ncbi:MAG: deoxyribose-phosphate aldolase [Eubacteriales Family XIII. Incertae Sedis bacterium]|jgi:deoxyribose-phosphate aldolase|nr:MAG: deoxyribose-phosphate aldolase [Clostridiales Family XIII bacterium]
MKPFNKYFDHTCLKPEATSSDIKKLCAEARKHDFYSVCVNGCYVKLAAGELSDSDVKVAAVIGFPLGAVSPEVKVLETNDCCANGASEIDMVINVGALKEGRYDYVIDDIAGVVSCADDYDAIVKVIIETCLLTDDEIIKACELSVSAGAEFVKTSTGFAGGGAEARHIELMRRTVGNLAQIKASGGIRSYAACKEMIAAGADRIGASASVQIMEEYLKENL